MTTRRWAVFLRTMIVALALAGASAVSAADSDRWRNLSPREKENVRRNYQRWQKLPPRDKEHLREEWERWQRLPQERRERLRRRYDELKR